MGNYDRKITGFYASLDDARRDRQRLIEQGLPEARLEILDAGHQAAIRSAPTTGATEERAADGADSNQVLKDLLVDGGIGAAVGTGLGALAEVALVAANVSLFVASPLIAPLAMLGWGAGLGGLVGAVAGAGNREGRLSDLVSDAIASGSAVLVAHARNENESRIAETVMRDSLPPAAKSA
ncbi:MAG: hypothetical protein ACM3SV_07850 [Betaproteobacteria bacterium]